MTKETACEIVARCSRCSREFVYVNPTSDMIDHYVPQGTPTKQVSETPECGGQIVLMLEGAFSRHADGESVQPEGKP